MFWGLFKTLLHADPFKNKAPGMSCVQHASVTLYLSILCSVERTCIPLPSIIFSFPFIFMFSLCVPLSFPSTCLFFFVFLFICCYPRYYFPPLDPPRAGSRLVHLLPPSSLLEHCDAEPVLPQQQAPQPLHRLYSRALLPLPETEGQ